MNIFTWMMVMLCFMDTPTSTEHAPLPDSIHSQEYIEKICLTEPYRALKLIDEMETRQMLPLYRLDNLRSAVYQNGLNMYRIALTYSLKVYQSDSLRKAPEKALQVLEQIADQYNATGNYTESTRYAIKGIELAKKTGDRKSEANLLLYIGINKRNMGLKKEADTYIEQAVRMQEQTAEGSREWETIDDLIYIYGMKITFALEDKKYQEAIDLLPGYEKLMEQFKACSGIPDGLYDMRQASAYAAYAYIFVANGQPDKGEAFYRKFDQTAYAASDDGNQMRFDYLLATKRYREALPYIRQNKQYWKEQGDTINYSYLERDLHFEAQAYDGLGDYKAAAQIYRQMYILLDSLRIREKHNGVLELTTLYETKEKEAQLIQQATRLRESRIIEAFAACMIGLLGLLLWRYIRHARLIRAKNEAMVGTIENLLGYKDELFRRKEENLLLREQLQAAENTLRKGDEAERYRLAAEEIPAEGDGKAETPGREKDVVVNGDIPEKEANNATFINGQALFDRMEYEIISHQLFLQPGFSREELMKRVHIPKNKFALLFKQYAGMSFPGYMNKLRLEYATELLKEHPEYTIDGIAKSCGISSTTTFYRLFFEKFGMTPTEYRESRKKHINE